ncbi:MAG: 4Fe-4S binding protein [Terracidiphilus sp.]
MGLVSLLSPVKIRRDAEACLDCGKCAKACPACLPVDRLIQIRSAECNACLVGFAKLPAVARVLQNSVCGTHPICRNRD